MERQDRRITSEISTEGITYIEVIWERDSLKSYQSYCELAKFNAKLDSFNLQGVTFQSTSLPSNTTQFLLKIDYISRQIQKKLLNMFVFH